MLHPTAFYDSREHHQFECCVAVAEVRAPPSLGAPNAHHHPPAMAIAMTGSSDSGRVHDVVGQLLATQVRIFNPAKTDIKNIIVNCL